MRITQRSEQWIVAAILLIYLVMAVSFSAGPIFEAPDEVEHVRFIRTMVQTHALPDPLARSYSEYHQAPLYYLLAAPIAKLIDMTDFEQIAARVNPYSLFEITVPGNDNKNRFLHTLTEAFPYQESPTALAVHLIRLISVTLGACTILTSYAIFCLLWPDRADSRLIALSIIAFWPEFLYSAGTVSNDALLNLFSTLTLYVLLDQLRRGLTWRSSVLLGITLGATLLTKVSGLFLIFPVGMALLIGLLRALLKTSQEPGSWKPVMSNFAACVGVIVLCMFIVCGWWFLRNQIQFGDATLDSTMLNKTWSTQAIRNGQVALDVGLSRMMWSYQTLWARFAGGIVPVHESMYTLFDILVVLSLGGTVLKLTRNGMKLVRRPASLGMAKPMSIAGAGSTGIIVVFALAWLAALLYNSSTAWSGNQGRYLLPAIAVWGIIGAYGLERWIPRRRRSLFTFCTILVLGTVAGISTFHYFLPAYRPLPGGTTIEHPVALRYANEAELIGISPALAKARPGDIIHITLYWRALKPVMPLVGVYLHTVGATIVMRDSLPGTGNLVSSDWQAGDTWAESYVIPIPADAPLQSTYSLIAGLYDLTTKAMLPVTDFSGQPVTPIVGQLAINGPPQTANSIQLAYRFGDLIDMTMLSLTRDNIHIQLCLTWYPLIETSADFHLFVHVFAQDHSLIQQVNAQPKGGQYPTFAWLSGESIADCVMLDDKKLQGRNWNIELGLFDSRTNDRLPVRMIDGSLLANGNVIVAAPVP